MKINKRQIAPLLILAYWMFYVVQQAVNSGSAHEIGITLATIEYCTTPGSIVVIPSLLVWLWVVRSKHQPGSEDDPKVIMSAALRLEASGDVTAAIAKYEDVMRRFPGTEAARDAEVSIRSLKAKIG
jgi:hypothetical protein